MKLIGIVLRFLADLFRPDVELSPEVRAYCRNEGVDPWALRTQALPRRGKACQTAPMSSSQLRPQGPVLHQEAAVRS